VIERLLDAFRKPELRGDRGESFHATFSAGIAAYPESGETLEELAAVAARKLAEAQAAGHNQIAIQRSGSVSVSPCRPHFTTDPLWVRDVEGEQFSLATGDSANLGPRFRGRRRHRAIDLRPLR
jgi:hypothetical protein